MIEHGYCLEALPVFIAQVLESRASVVRITFVSSSPDACKCCVYTNTHSNYAHVYYSYIYIYIYINIYIYIYTHTHTHTHTGCPETHAEDFQGRSLN
jgi:hypothetical protein